MCDFDDLTWVLLTEVDKNVIFEDAPSLPTTFDEVDKMLEKRVCELHQAAILKLQHTGSKTGPHFVLATGRIIDPISGLPDWQIFDGGQNPDTTSDPILTAAGPLCSQAGSPRASGQTSLRGHLPLPEGDGGFCHHNELLQYTLAGSEARFYSATITSGRSPAALALSAGSPVEVLVTDPFGKQLGNTGGGDDILQIPQGSYFRDGLLQDDDENIPPSPDATATKNAYILNPVSGTYTANINGTGLGTYRLSYTTIATDKDIQTTSSSGVSNGGSINQFNFTYSLVPGTPVTLMRMASFESTLADIQNSLQLGLIDNHGIANSLSQKIQAAQQATRSENANILSAFKNEISAQSGRHITVDVAHMLSEDADWLVSH